jgi:hypothetical protein
VSNNRSSYRIFDSQDPKYRIYAFPVKLFYNYTIAIDCNQGFEMFCGLYSTTLDTTNKGKDLITKTYKKVNNSVFCQPFLYDKLDVKFWSFITDSSKLLDDDSITRWDIANREQDLKLFIKIPASCKSSITVLEGDFRSFNDAKYVPVRYTKQASNGASITQTTWEYRQNHTILNFGDARDKSAGLNTNEYSFTPISKVQLLAFNTGESYPFADKLIEYLCNSAITPIDEITDNIKRAQKVMSQNHHYFKIAGLWEDKMQKIIYDYMINAGPIEAVKSGTSIKLVDKRRGLHPRLGHISKSTLYDVLGYIDKDAEKLYASWALDAAANKAVVHDSIQNVDIYNGLYDL